MNARVIVNPVSGADDAPERLKEINERLRAALGEVDIVMTVGPGDAERLARQAARDQVGRLFVAGGDGTLNEAVNGLAQEDALERTELSVLPLGTGNDFAHGLGIPTDLSAALEIGAAGTLLPLDVGTLNDRCFVNVSAGGFIAEVSDAVSPQLKTIAGRMAYLIGGAQVLGEYEAPEARIRLRQPDGVFERQMRVQLFAVCNSRFIGGGRTIAPHAVIDDGLLDVCIVEAMPALEFVALLTRMSGGEHVRDARVLYFQAAEIDVDLPSAIKVNTDGEVIEARSCRYRLRRGGARFRSGPSPFARAADAAPLQWAPAATGG
jgi:diacylglycerol kinase (ATP)